MEQINSSAFKNPSHRDDSGRSRSPLNAARQGALLKTSKAILLKMHLLRRPQPLPLTELFQVQIGIASTSRTESYPPSPHSKKMQKKILIQERNREKRIRESL